MDRRVILAVILTAIVIVVTPMLFPGASVPISADSTQMDTVHARTANDSVRAPQPSANTASASTPQAAMAPAPATAKGSVYTTGDSLSVVDPHMTVWYGSAGAAPLRVSLRDYLSRDTARAAGPVVLEPGPRAPLLSYALSLPDTTVDLSRLSFVLQEGPEPNAVSYRADVGKKAVTVSYRNPTSDSGRYVVHASVNVGGETGAGTLLITLPRTLVSAETDTVDDLRHLSFAYLAKGGSVKNLAFTKLDSGARETVTGSLEWAAVRNKYFLVAVISPDTAITNITFTGAARVDKLAPDANGVVSIPLKNGRAAFDLYLGPQEYKRLHSVGYQLAEVNQYASWLHAVVQPFASIVTRVLLWMKQASGLGYGWVIIIFGVAVRLLLWPLNQSAMRTSIRMQRIQPELSEVQKKYKGEPKKQQEMLIKIYQAHGMTPFSPMMGCLPMLLPMPILFALYFVFLNTIEFRGVSFLWMHDISAADPYYITPLVMGLSMFALSWIGLRGTPPSAQTRMMSYMMPVVMTFMFLRFAAGLNLYYAVQNLAALPQQWLLARERVGIGAKGNTTGGARGGGTGRR